MFMHRLIAGSRRMHQLITALLLMLLLTAPATGKADEAQLTEHRIKAAFLYNFSRFTSWPKATLQARSEFSLCTLGSTLFAQQLESLAGKTVHGKTLAVKNLDRLEEVVDCQLVFISQSDELAETLSTLQELPVLTVSDAAAFTEKGGIIQFKIVENKVRFRINVDAARTAGLTISSKLLSLAISVTGAR